MTVKIIIPQEDFEAEYAARSGVSIEQIHAHGRGAVPCECDEPECLGWQMVNLADHAEDQRLRTIG
jgi:hypothetical protein